MVATFGVIRFHYTANDVAKRSRSGRRASAWDKEPVSVPAEKVMYLVSLIEENAVVEASLGGRITAGEVRVFGDELVNVLGSLAGQSYSMLLDLSRAKPLGDAALLNLADVKDRCLESGAQQIVTVAADEEDSIHQQTQRLQQVLEGRERFENEPFRAYQDEPDIAA